MKMPAHSRSSVHTDFMPHYTKITSCVKTPQEREILRKGLDNLHAELMSAQAVTICLDCALNTAVLGESNHDICLMSLLHVVLEKATKNMVGSRD